LPVTLANLRQAKPAAKASALTDDRGVATLTILRSMSYLIEAIPWNPASADTSSPQAWLFTTSTGGIAAIDADRPLSLKTTK